jgi:hypothetical protein
MVGDFSTLFSTQLQDSFFNSAAEFSPGLIKALLRPSEALFDA